MWMFANIPEYEAPHLHVGQEVRARVASHPDREFKGRITVIGASVDPNTRRVYVRSEISDPDHLLRAGMFAKFTIEVSEPMRSIAVPQAAVVRETDGQMSIWTTTDHKHFTRRTVKIAHQQDGLVEVPEGLQGGEEIVAEGAVFLSNKLSGGASD